MFETCLINCDMVMLYDAIVAMSWELCLYHLQASLFCSSGRGLHSNFSCFFLLLAAIFIVEIWVIQWILFCLIAFTFGNGGGILQSKKGHWFPPTLGPVLIACSGYTCAAAGLNNFGNGFCLGIFPKKHGNKVDIIAWVYDSADFNTMRI